MDEATLTNEMYLGLQLLEGAGVDRRDLSLAETIFVACEADDDPNVRILALYRQAQCLHYRGKSVRAFLLLDCNRHLLIGQPISTETRLQCMLILITITEAAFPHLPLREKCERIYSKATTPKLRADAAHRVGRLALRENDLDQALVWFTRAYEELLSIKKPDDLVLHAKIAVVGQLGPLLQITQKFDDQEASDMFSEAQTHWAKKIRDPCVWARYWKHRADAAWKRRVWPCYFICILRSKHMALKCLWQLHR